MENPVELTKDEIIRAIDALSRLYANFVNNGVKDVEYISNKIKEVVDKL